MAERHGHGNERARRAALAIAAMLAGRGTGREAGDEPNVDLVPHQSEIAGLSRSVVGALKMTDSGWTPPAGGVRGPSPGLSPSS